MQTKECIAKRRSIRGYNGESVSREEVLHLVEYAALAPSGMNRQPWKFHVESNLENIEKIASFSSSQKDWIKTSQHLLFVFLDKESSYNEERDLMGLGASIENFMLAACDDGIGTCWLGGVLSNTAEILDIVGIKDDSLSLKAIITVGRFDDKELIPTRKPMSEILI